MVFFSLFLLLLSSFFLPFFPAVNFILSFSSVFFLSLCSSSFYSPFLHFCLISYSALRFRANKQSFNRQQNTEQLKCVTGGRAKETKRKTRTKAPTYSTDNTKTGKALNIRKTNGQQLPKKRPKEKRPATLRNRQSRQTKQSTPSLMETPARDQKCRFF